MSTISEQARAAAIEQIDRDFQTVLTRWQKLAPWQQTTKGAIAAVKGGPGSGFHGHAGRPGERGGSAPSGVDAQHRITETDPLLQRGPAWDKLGNGFRGGEDAFATYLQRNRIDINNLISPDRLDRFMEIANDDSLRLDEDQIVYFALDGAHLKQMRAGFTFNAIGPRITTGDAKLAAKQVRGKGAVLFEAILPKGSLAVPSSINGHDTTVLLPGSSFRVEGVQGNRIRVSLADDGVGFINQLAAFRNRAKSSKGASAALKGGPGSGFHGHAGRPGQVGGSAPADTALREEDSDAEAFVYPKEVRFPQHNVTLVGDIAKLHDFNFTPDDIANLFDLGPDVSIRVYIQEESTGGLSISGTWTTTDENEATVGECHRVLEPDLRTAKLELLTLEPSYMGQGQGTAIAHLWFDTLVRNGYETARLWAGLSIGKYAWAKEGADYEIRSDAEAATENFEAWVEEKQIPGLSERLPTFHSAYEVATYTHPDGYMLTGNDIQNDDVAPDLNLPLGKAFMLDEGDYGHGDWQAVVRLKAKATKAVSLPPSTVAKGRVYIDTGKPLTGASDAAFWVQYTTEAEGDPLFGFSQPSAEKGAVAAVKGGPGSGFHGHAGRPGERGGSAPEGTPSSGGGGGSSAAATPKTTSISKVTSTSPKPTTGGSSGSSAQAKPVASTQAIQIAKRKQSGGQTGNLLAGITGKHFRQLGFSPKIVKQLKSLNRGLRDKNQQQSTIDRILTALGDGSDLGAALHAQLDTERNLADDKLKKLNLPPPRHRYGSPRAPAGMGGGGAGGGGGGGSGGKGEKKKQEGPNRANTKLKRGNAPKGSAKRGKADDEAKRKAAYDQRVARERKQEELQHIAKKKQKQRQNQAEGNREVGETIYLGESPFQTLQDQGATLTNGQQTFPWPAVLESYEVFAGLGVPFGRTGDIALIRRDALPPRKRPAVKSIKGGAGSGFHGHAGRPGERGGSAPRESAVTDLDVTGTEAMRSAEEALNRGQTHSYLAGRVDQHYRAIGVSEAILKQLRTLRDMHDWGGDNQAAAKRMILSALQEDSELGRALRAQIATETELAQRLQGHLETLWEQRKEELVSDWNWAKQIAGQDEDLYVGGDWYSPDAEESFLASQRTRFLRDHAALYRKGEVGGDIESWTTNERGAWMGNPGNIGWDHRLEWSEVFDNYHVLAGFGFHYGAPGEAEVTLIRKSAVPRLNPSVKGGPGSGFHGHAGRPGERGGSAPRGTATPPSADEVRTDSEGHEDALDALDFESDPIVRAWLGNGSEYESISSTLRLEDRTPVFKHKVVSALAEGIGISYDDANDFIRHWADSSNQHYAAQMIQQEAANLFGSPYSDWQREQGERMQRTWEKDFDRGLDYLSLFDEIDSDMADVLRMQALRDLPFPEMARQRFDEIFPEGLALPLKRRSVDEVVSEVNRIKAGVTQMREEQRDWVRKALQWTYNHTQADLESQGITGDILLYRGVGGEGVAGLAVGATTTVATNALSSWSASRSVATGFTGVKEGAVFAVKVTVSRVYSTPRTGFGCLNEWEFVLTGDEADEATVVYTRFDQEIKELKALPEDAMAKPAVINLDDGDENADWIKRVNGGKSRAQELAIHAKLTEAGPPAVEEDGWPDVEPLADEEAADSEAE